jgi:N-methylhydantoinase B/oxoprolinase/acetone carboxylase alpha subunit
MSLFVDIVSVVAGLASLAGVSLKDLRQQIPTAQSDAAEIRKFIDFLQGRDVLLAPIDDEIQAAVIQSIEDIKQQTEYLSAKCNDEGVKTILLKLRLTMSEELRKLHKIDATTSQGKYKMYVSLQTLRFHFSRALALFCAAFDIKVDPSVKTIIQRV